jgi:proteasome assembly chaperone (PAC2) family protein
MIDVKASKAIEVLAEKITKLEIDLFAANCRANELEEANRRLTNERDALTNENKLLKEAYHA